jgi:hypothetical protein
MRRPAIAAAGFALSGGAAVDLTGAAHVAPGADRSGRLLFVSVEPVDHSHRGRELAAVALRAMQTSFAGSRGTAADALLTAMAGANAAVLAQNRPAASGRWQRDSCVGATAVATVGRQIAVVQVPPSQAILVQDRQIYTFPDLASWRSDYAPGVALPNAHPLGFDDDPVPILCVSEAAPGDIVLLCSTSMGRILARDDDAMLDLYGGTMLTSDLEGSLDRLERLAARHRIGDAYAVIVSLGRLPRRPRLRFSSGGEGRLSRQLVVAAETPAPSLFRSSARGDAALVPRSGLRDWIVDTAELASGGKGKPPLSMPRQRMLAAPGALSVQRYRETAGLSPELRAHLPRGPGLQVPARLLAVSLLLFVALGGTGVAMNRQKDRERQAIVALASADAELRAAVGNPGVAMTAVTQAERALAEARAAGADGIELAGREAELARLRDDVWRVRRLSNVVRIGALPEGASADTARLALANRTLYVAAGDLYELDPEQRLLVGLLSQGETVTGGTAGRIAHVSLDGGEVVASDGVATFRRDSSGHWERSELPVGDVGGLRAEMPIITWGKASYAISWDGDIVRFDEVAGAVRADVWAAILDVPDLEKATDIAVDGRIHILLDDGRILTFSRGELAETVSPFIAPPATDPAFLAAAPLASAHYVVDRNGAIGGSKGRVIRIGTNGEAWQYLAPEPAPGDPLSQAVAVSLAATVDLAIDELSGTIYWISNGEIWQARLPAV